MIMKQFFSLVCASLLALSMSATTFDYNAEGTQDQTIDGIHIVLAKANGSTVPAYSSYNGMKLYANNTITIDAEQAFSNVQLVFCKNDGKDYLTMTASTGELVSGGTSTALDDPKVDVWNGSANHLVFTMGTKGQRVLRQIVVDGDPIDIVPPSDVVAIDTAEWDPEFVWYSEPTAIITPDTTFSKKEYIFVETNIRVHCTQGTINDTASTPYFNCNAGYTLSFEATKPIKGIVINGYVRKQFTASVDKGNIEYCSPGALEEDTEGYPVVIISDIDSTAVTIFCDKQLRCYTVYVYFDANPTETLDCGGSQGGGETEFLTFDKAEAVYESEISEEEGKPNYTIFLSNQAADVPYMALDLYPTATGDLVGQYSMDDESLGDYTWYQYGEGDEDFTWATEGQLVINKEGDVYSISGYVTCDDNNTYNFSFSGAMPFYTDTEYYDGQQGIDETQVEQQAQKILRRGQLLIQRNHSVYDVTGRRVE